MKKFSTQTKQTVKKEPVQKEQPLNEEEILKYGILKLMDDFLAVRSYGPATRYQTAGTIKIVGKEPFLEALMDFLTEYTNKGKIKLLEGFKSQITDWNIIDTRIDKLKSEFETYRIQKQIEKEKNKIKALYESNTDEEIFLSKIDKMSKKGSVDFKIDAINELVIDKVFSKDFSLKILEKLNGK